MAITVIQHNVETGMSEKVEVFETLSLGDVQGLEDKKRKDAENQKEFVRTFNALKMEQFKVFIQNRTTSTYTVIEYEEVEDMYIYLDDIFDDVQYLAVGLYTEDYKAKQATVYTNQYEFVFTFDGKNKVIECDVKSKTGEPVAKLLAKTYDDYLDLLEETRKLAFHYRAL